MTRIFIFLFIFTSISFGLFSKNLDSLVNIQGYYVTRFLKDEISFAYDQKINKIKGKSYSTPIDYKHVSFFFPLCIDNKRIDKDILEVIPVENNLHKDSLYYLPLSKYAEKYIKTSFNLNLDLSKEICVFSEVNRFSPYYIKNGDNNFLYKITFIEGYTLKKTLLNIEKNRAPLDIDIYAVNKESPIIELFFVVEIKSYSTHIKIEGLKEWYPYIE